MSSDRTIDRTPPADRVGELLEEHLPGLRAFVRLRSGGMLRELEASTDLVQSVCREVLEHADRCQHGGEAGFRRWLYRTALRKIADRYAFYRAARRDVRREERGAPDDASLVGAYASICSPSRAASAREQVERVEAAFDLLPAAYRDAIVGARLLGLTTRELATQLGRSEAATRTVLCRAIARLVELLDEGGRP
ncbi:MAG: sigma-70 family RNA polymerase sigma factor [Planctomycetes bacterium]|nr:sigma-70 family RNA polymerase sigma factor [Planctomycetota bacterium]